MDARSSISTPPASGSTSGIRCTIDSTASFSTAAAWPGSTGVGLDIDYLEYSNTEKLRPFYRRPPAPRSRGLRAPSVLLLGLEAGVVQCAQHAGQVGPPAGLQHQL